MTSSDRGYTVLLSHLHNASSSLPISTIQSALAHYLATIAPIPTPLSATAISSPFYRAQPFTHAKLQSLSTAYRHATHLKFKAAIDAQNSPSKLKALLRRSVPMKMSQWVNDVLKGVYGGHPVLRVASCSGLLLGVEDVKIGDATTNGVDLSSARSGVETEIVVALAEVMDTYAHSLGLGAPSNAVEEWEKEFQPAGQDVISLVLILASHSLPLVAERKLMALPLHNLTRLLMSTLSSAFKAGTFLSSVSASVTLSPSHQVHISVSSPLAQTLQSITSSPLTVSISSISRITAKVLALMIDSPSTSQLEKGLNSISETLDTLREMAKQVERDWIACPLASFTDLDIAEESKEISKSVWMILKTFLFSNIMLAEAVLTASIFLPPRSHTLTPVTFALQILNILSHLSFVISELGGVATSSQGFEHLQKTFYLALDILAQGDGKNGDFGLKAEEYVQQICFSLNSLRAESVATSPRQAKQAFTLATIEQLVPVLSEKCIEESVWSVCYPHLFDPSHRETFESAHSVVLAIFASQGQRQQLFPSGNRAPESPDIPKTASTSRRYLLDQRFVGAGKQIIGSEEISKTGSPATSATFVKRLVPFYAKCLINNSMDGKLNTPQLRLAYSALVRGASISANEKGYDDISLAWYCVELILDTIKELSDDGSQPSKSKGKSNADNDAGNKFDRIHRLHLMLISTISSLPLPLMLRALDETRVLITAYNPPADSGADKGAKAELVEALFSELLEKVGHREKEAGMRWWYKYRSTFISDFEQEDNKGTLEMGDEMKGKLEAASGEKAMLSRL